MGKTVFASDLYSLGVTMYQMLTGVLPYDTPAPRDLEKLRRGELVRPPRLRNSSIPKSFNDIVMKAMAPNLTERYRRAGELLADLEDHLPSRTGSSAKPTNALAGGERHIGTSVQDKVRGIQSNLQTRDTLPARFCWQCHKPLHARTDRCPFCGENQ